MLISPSGNAAVWPYEMQDSHGEWCVGISRIHLPCGAEDDQFCEKDGHATMEVPIWYGWSHDSKYFAVLWAATRSNTIEVSILSAEGEVHEAVCWSIDDPKDIQSSCMVDFECSWSSTLDSLLFRNRDQTLAGANIVAGTNERCYCLPIPLPPEGTHGPGSRVVGSQVVWSWCGQYIEYCQERTTAEGKSLGLYGLIWDVSEEEVICEWHCAGGDLISSRVRWSMNGLMCLVLNGQDSQLIALPKEAGSEPQVMPYNGPLPWCLGLCISDLVFSPCGKYVHLFEEMTREGRGLSYEEDIDIMLVRFQLPASARHGKMYKLWQCRVYPSATAHAEDYYMFSRRLLMSTLKWHPSPVSRGLFAVADEFGCLYVFSIDPLEILQQWSGFKLLKMAAREQ